MSAHTLFKKQIFAAAKIMLKYMDRSTDPCSDFYQFACGNWAKHNPIPKDKAAYDTFEMIRESLDSVLKELLEDHMSRGFDSSTTDATVKAKYLFQSCMNYGNCGFRSGRYFRRTSPCAGFNMRNVARDLGAAHGTAPYTALGWAWRMAYAEA